MSKDIFKELGVLINNEDNLEQFQIGKAAMIAELTIECHKVIQSGEYNAIQIRIIQQNYIDKIAKIQGITFYGEK